MLQTLHILRFISILVILLIVGNTCPAQSPVIEKLKLKENSEFYLNSYSSLLKEADSNTYPILLSVGAGAHTYKFINQYYFEANTLSYIGQELYFETGLILYRNRNHDNEDFTTNLVYINLILLHRWEITQKIFIYGGGGFSYWPPGNLLTNLIFKSDFKLANLLFIGIEIKKGLYFSTKASKYFMYPAISLNFSVEL